jgi:hypothetical protein
LGLTTYTDEIVSTFNLVRRAGLNTQEERAGRETREEDLEIGTSSSWAPEKEAENEAPYLQNG